MQAPKRLEWTGSSMRGYHPHKTPSGAFDPEIFGAPDLDASNLEAIDEQYDGNHRTESLGLKCLANRPMLIPQISTDSVFSRVEGETIEACDHENNFDDESAAQSVPIGIRSFGRRCNISEEYQHNSAPSCISTLYSSGNSPTIENGDLVTEPFSMTSLPDRLACEETVNAMTNAVLDDDECQEQIKANNLYQMMNQGGPIMMIPANSAFPQMFHLNAAQLAQASQVASAQMNVLFKTELCRSWQFNTCRYADRCLFAHGEQELRPLIRPRHNKYKTELCITFHSFGLCPYGARCNFVHEMEEHRPAKHSVPSLYKTRLCRTFIERGICPYGDKCDFAHGTTDLSYDITKHPKYRTKLCRSFQETGNCIYGDRCCFSHTLMRTPDYEDIVPLGILPKLYQPTQSQIIPGSSGLTLQNKINTENNDKSPTTPMQKENNQNKKQSCRRMKFTGKCPYGSHCIYSHDGDIKRASQRG